MLKKWEAAAREAVRSVLKREDLPALLGLPAESRAQLRQDRELRRYKRVCKASFDRWFARLPRPLELSKDVEASIHPVRGCACALRAWRLAMLVVCFLGGCRCRRVYELSENAKLLHFVFACRSFGWPRPVVSAILTASCQCTSVTAATPTRWTSTAGPSRSM